MLGDRNTAEEFGPTDLLPRPYAEVRREREGHRARRRSHVGSGESRKNTFLEALTDRRPVSRREHLANLAKIVYEVGSLRWKQWLANAHRRT